MVLDLKKMAEVDFMDEHTFLYNEELILAERLERKGYHCACCTDTKIIHNHSTTIKTFLDKKKIRKIQRESFSYYLKEYRNFSILKRWVCDCFYMMKLMILN